MSFLLRQRIITTTHMRPMSCKSSGLAGVQGLTAAAPCMAEGEYPNEIVAVCHYCPLLSPFLVVGILTRSFLHTVLPSWTSWPVLLQICAQHEDKFVPPLSDTCLSSNQVTLHFFPAFESIPVPGSISFGVGCHDQGSLRQGMGMGMKKCPKVQEGWALLQHHSSALLKQTQHGGTGASDKKLLVWSLFPCSFQKPSNLLFPKTLLLRELDWLFRDSSCRGNSRQAPAGKISARTVKVISMKISPLIRTGRHLNRQVSAAPTPVPAISLSLATA